MWKHRASSRPDPAPKDKDENPPRPLSNLGLFGRSRRSSRKGGFWLRGIFFLTYLFPPLICIVVSLSMLFFFCLLSLCLWIYLLHSLPLPISPPLLELTNFTESSCIHASAAAFLPKVVNLSSIDPLLLTTFEFIDVLYRVLIRLPALYYLSFSPPTVCPLFVIYLHPHGLISIFQPVNLSSVESIIFCCFRTSLN